MVTSSLSGWSWMVRLVISNRPRSIGSGASARFKVKYGSASSSPASFGGGPGWCRLVGSVQLGKGGAGGAALGVEVVVGLPQSLGERVVGFEVLGLAHHVVLPTGEIGQSPL